MTRSHGEGVGGGGPERRTPRWVVRFGRHPWLSFPPPPERDRGDINLPRETVAYALKGEKNHYFKSPLFLAARRSRSPEKPEGSLMTRDASILGLPRARGAESAFELPLHPRVRLSAVTSVVMVPSSPRPPGSLPAAASRGRTEPGKIIRK